MLLSTIWLATLINSIKNLKTETDLFALPAFEILVNSSLNLEDFAENGIFKMIF
jgi:hypothetical protein